MLVISINIIETLTYNSYNKPQKQKILKSIYILKL